MRTLYCHKLSTTQAFLAPPIALVGRLRETVLMVVVMELRVRLPEEHPAEPPGLEMPAGVIHGVADVDPQEHHLPAQSGCIAGRAKKRRRGCFDANEKECETA